MKQWILKTVDQEQIEQFAKQAEIDPFIARLLFLRGICDTEQTRQFVRSDVRAFHDPFLLEDMKQATQRIRHAIRQREPITVYGDYDADGVTATAVLLLALRSLGAVVDYYIPQRTEEGYGLHREALDVLAARGTRLVITVDLGVTALEEVEYAKKLGLDCIITDHHEPFDCLPAACAVLDPKWEGTAYPYGYLAGVGVALKLVTALLEEQPLTQVLQRYLDIVCVGTVSDIVPLTGENRFLVQHGLRLLQHTKNLGLRALMDFCLKDKQKVDATTIGYLLGPRINAAGRMGQAEDALLLLLSQTHEEAEERAARLCAINQERRGVEEEIFQQAVQLAEQADPSCGVLIVAGEGWHCGVIGIVASRLLDRFQKPVVLLSVEGDLAHGSARSMPGFDLFEAFCQCEACLEKYGGHELAAGLTLKREQIPAFSKAMWELADRVSGEREWTQALEIDLELPPSCLTLEFANKLQFFEPFGIGNPQPVFLLRRACVVQASPTKDGKHLRFCVRKGTEKFSCIAFGKGELPLRPGEEVDLAFHLTASEYRGTSSLQFLVQDIHWSEESERDLL